MNKNDIVNLAIIVVSVIGVSAYLWYAVPLSLAEAQPSSVHDYTGAVNFNPPP
jgi:hypothetical protein